LRIRLLFLDLESIYEQILTIAKQFQEANGLGGIFFTEQGGWCALSNREQVAQYLMNRNINRRSGVHFSLQVASDHTGSTICPIPN
jgi:hypothetical protein